ncbi:TetR/AcrR family transcriptional regulator [Herbihabitans rhizosphaerae]|nr:TetR/AcrR family transcriptional regulator [Herbihabitans rhizosphaerae]
MDADQRRADRRARLLEAGLELFGTTGYATASVKQVCQAAGLTERYFYESFRDREDLLTCVYNDLISQVQQATLAALGTSESSVRALARTGIDTFVRTLAADGRRARVVFIEVVGVSPALERRRRAVMREFAQLITAIGLAHVGVPTNNRLEVGSMFFVGGLTELMVDWTLGDKKSSPDELSDVAAAILMAGFDLFRSEIPETV